MCSNRRDETLEVFRKLGLQEESERERLRKLANLGKHSEGQHEQHLTPVTQNNTREEGDDAELESAS